MIWENIKAFLAHPFDPNQDGKTSALEWFAFAGLVFVISYVWARLLGYLLED
jgi:hypothetical protein